PALYGELGVPISYAGIISMIVAGGTIISSFQSGRVIKRLGTGKVTTISVFMTAVALFGVSSSHSFFVICLWAIPLGLGAGSVDAALNSYVALHYKAKHMNWLHCFWGIGATTGPIIMSYFLLNGRTWNMGYRTISIIQFCLAGILILTLSLWNKVGKEALPEKEEEKISFAFKDLIKLPGAKVALISFFCYCAIETTAGLWGSSYLVIVKGITAQTAAKWISMFYFGITFGRFLSGFLTFKFTNRQMVRLGLVVLSCGVILFFLSFPDIAMLVGFFMIGLGCAPIYPSLLHETPVNFGSRYSQAIMGIQMACAYIGATFMPPIFGWIASKSSYQIFPFYLGILLIVMIIMIETSNRTVKVHTLSD
ncbi:MAG: MFS transporter, partial [Mobilitalea sp.]